MLLITLEGMDCSGKSTQAELLRHSLERHGRPAVVIQEPGCTEIGAEVRAMVKKPRAEMVHPETELFLFQASRSQLVRNVIRPTIEAGTVVICDRFYDSTWVYQGWAGGVNLLEVEMTNRLAANDIKIDRTLLFRLPLEEALSRMRTRADGTDRIERKGDTYHRKVHAGYDQLARTYPDRVKVINADAPIETVAAEVLSKVLPLLT